jgi:hypothetical protein
MNGLDTQTRRRLWYVRASDVTTVLLAIVT